MYSAMEIVDCRANMKANFFKFLINISNQQPDYNIGSHCVNRVYIFFVYIHTYSGQNQASRKHKYNSWNKRKKGEFFIETSQNTPPLGAGMNGFKKNQFRNRGGVSHEFGVMPRL
jgi:hypothetical protein